MPDQSQCPICEHINRTDARFCGKCGQPLPGKPKQRWLWLIGALLVPAFAFFLWHQLQSDNPLDTPTITVVAPTVRVQNPVSQVTPTAAAATITQQIATPTPRPTNTPLPSPTPRPSSTAPPPTATPIPKPQTVIYGQSVNGAALAATRIGSGANTVILIGGLHAGFAPGSVAVAQQAAAHFSRHPDDLPPSITLYVIVNANPDSPTAPGELEGRLNARQIDLNRNWDCRWIPDPQWRNQTVSGSGGTAPFSEPESSALRDFVLARDPVAVLFWEARATGGLVSPGSCGARPRVSAAIAGIYGLAAGYNVANFEDLTNQALNGDSTNWLDEQGIPAMAVLLPTYSDDDWQNNLAGIQALLDAVK